MHIFQQRAQNESRKCTRKIICDITRNISEELSMFNNTNSKRDFIYAFYKDHCPWKVTHRVLILEFAFTE